MTIEEFNNATEADAQAALLRCCHSGRWVNLLLAGRPFADEASIVAGADEAWAACGRDDYLEAFAGHPRIGGVDTLRERFASTRDWTQQEQAGARQASEEVLQRLASGNDRYLERFGHIFIVCATGKSAEEMLALLEARLANAPDEELAIAAREQHKITHLRLARLLAGPLEVPAS